MMVPKSPLSTKHKMSVVLFVLHSFQFHHTILTYIASTAHVMTHGLKFTFMPQAYPVNFHREVSLTLLYILSHFSQQNH